MSSVSRTLRLTLAVVVGLTMSMAFTASASAAPQTAAPAAEATWDLSNGEQQACIPVQHSYSTYFVGFVAGYWTTPLVPEVQGLPEGTVVSMVSSVPPDDNGDRYIGVIWLLVELPPLDYGVYPAELVVTDGTVTQTMPITLKTLGTPGC